MTVDYVPNLNRLYQSQGFPPYNWSVFEDAPWAEMVKPLAEACLGLISSAGVYEDEAEPFESWAVNDLSHRLTPVDAPFERLRLRHNYYDHRDALADMNCVFPVHRLAELAGSGFIGRLAPKAVTLGMGRMYKRTALCEQTAPRILEVFRDQGADAALLIAA